MNGRFETFASLPPMTPVQITAQLDTLLAQNQHIWVEYTENPSFENYFWRNWPLPAKKDPSGSWVLAQLEVCVRQNPYAYVRVVAYCPQTHAVSQSFLVRVPANPV